MDHLSELEDRLMRGIVVICELGKGSSSVLDRERLLGQGRGRQTGPRLGAGGDCAPGRVRTQRYRRFTPTGPSALVVDMSISVITEASVTAWGMGVSHWLEHSSPDSPNERTSIWGREFVWDDGNDVDDSTLRELAEKALEGIGYRPMAWWLFTAPADDHYPNEPYWHSVLERIPGSTKGWRD